MKMPAGVTASEEQRCIFTGFQKIQLIIYKWLARLGFHAAAVHAGRSMLFLQVFEIWVYHSLAIYSLILAKILHHVSRVREARKTGHGNILVVPEYGELLLADLDRAATELYHLILVQGTSPNPFCPNCLKTIASNSQATYLRDQNTVSCLHAHC